MHTISALRISVRIEDGAKLGGVCHLCVLNHPRLIGCHLERSLRYHLEDPDSKELSCVTKGEERDQGPTPRLGLIFKGSHIILTHISLF